jgi:hypothetical protein
MIRWQPANSGELRERRTMNKKLFIMVVLLLSVSSLNVRRVVAQSCTSPTMNSIKRAIEHKYRSASNPDYSFREAEPPAEVEAIVGELERNNLIVTPATNPDVDVSFVYVVSQRGRAGDRRLLRISMLGKYATLFTLGNTERETRLITTGAANTSEGKIIRALTSRRYTLLNRNILGCRSNLRRSEHITNAQQIKVWQALFCDVVEMPVAG